MRKVGIILFILVSIVLLAGAAWAKKGNHDPVPNNIFTFNFPVSLSLAGDHSTMITR